MKFAIDLDGTITARPEFFKEFIAEQLKAGHEVHILSSDQVDEDRNVEEPTHKVILLGNLGIVDWTKMISIERDDQHVKIGKAKAEYCRDNEIDVMIDNDPAFIHEIKVKAPKTIALLMV